MLPQKAEIISPTLCGVRAAAPMRHLMKETFPYFIHLMAHEVPLRLSNGLMEG